MVELKPRPDNWPILYGICLPAPGDDVKRGKKQFPEAAKQPIFAARIERQATPVGWTAATMANDKQPIVIKKYANRRLYNTGTSTYVTLEDLAQMVKAGEDFVVYDAKSNDEITRAVLTQIIFEQESKVGQNLLPITFMRQLIRFYGDSMQSLVPSYLEFSIDRLTTDQQKFRDQFADAFAGKAFPHQLFGALDEQVRKNMAIFNQALTMFNPFVPNAGQAAAPAGEAEAAGAKTASNDIDELRRQMAAMQQRLDVLSKD
jgi:polyhydroxyalkanoate synthesis repressor PhaR